MHAVRGGSACAGGPSVSHPASAEFRAKAPGISITAILVIAAVVFACSIYANLSLAVTDPRDYRFFPPFRPYVNANHNKHLGGEYYQMAEALVAGAGFADPFDRPTGPTAWQPPVLPSILAGLLWVCGSRDGVMAVVVFLQDYILVVTGLFVLVLARPAASRLGQRTAAALFLFLLLCHFQLNFQFTHDCWLVMLALTVLVGVCSRRPLSGGRAAAGWGLFGGLCALTSPILGFTWGVCTVGVWLREPVFRPLGIAILVAGLTLAPWTIRNYLVFGRLIPIKSNLAYELYQSHCLQQQGLMKGATFSHHPFRTHRQERREYERLGEVAYMDLKWQQFLDAVRTDPWDFIRRVGERFLGATLWYVPFRDDELTRPVTLWISRLTHPLPFLGLLLLVGTALAKPLHRAQWVTIAVYLSFLLPYVATSYYERYAVPLLGVKALLVFWAADWLWSLSLRRQIVIVPLTDSDACAARSTQLRTVKA